MIVRVLIAAPLGLGLGDRLPAVADLELLVEVLEVRLDRRRRDAEVDDDLLVREAPGQELENVTLDLLGERATPVDAAGNPVDLTIPDETNSGEHDDDTGPGPGEGDE